MKNGLGSRLLAILMHNVSTRNYKRVIPEMAESMRISKSSVSRQFIEASAQRATYAFYGLRRLIMSPLRLAIFGILVLLYICPSGYAAEPTETPSETAVKYY